jgi:hypothetical protein
MDCSSPRTPGLVFSHRHEVLNAVRHYIYSSKIKDYRLNPPAQIHLRSHCKSNIKKCRGQKKGKMQLFSKKIKNNFGCRDTYNK